MREDGTDETNRTNNPAFDFNPDWQPLDDDDDETTTTTRTTTTE